jgi:hypothetical protein
VPEPALWRCEIQAQGLGASSRFNVPFQRARSPCPLPLKGERGSDARHDLVSVHGSQFVNA